MPIKLQRDWKQQQQQFVLLAIILCLCHYTNVAKLYVRRRCRFLAREILLMTLSLCRIYLCKMQFYEKNCRVPYCFPMCTKAYLVKNCLEKLKFETKSRIVHRLEFVEWNMPNSSADASGLLFLLETTKKSFEPSLWNLEIYVQPF